MSEAAQVVAWCLAVYFAVFVVVSIVFVGIAAVSTRRQRHQLLPSTLRRIMHTELAPQISVVVPAYNEAAVVIDSVRSLLSLDYPELEVVLVNDGSTDATLELVREEFDLQPSSRAPLAQLEHLIVRGVYEPRAPIPLLVVDKENGGRSDALNAGVVYAHGPLVAVMDADEVLEQDGLARVVRPFLVDPARTIAVGASLGVANGCHIVRGRIVERRRPRNVLALFQAVEYERAFRVGRVAWSTLGSLPLISGGFGVFRRDLLVAAGGFDRSTMGEDFEVTLRLHRYCRDAGIPYRIVQIPEVVCWTIVPDTVRVLRRQRRRWQRGLRQVMRKHIGMAFRPRYGLVGMVAIPWTFFYELVAPIIIVLATTFLLVGFFLGDIGLGTLILVGVAAWASGVVPTLGAFALSDAPAGSARGWGNFAAIVGASFVEFVGYQQLTLVFRLESAVKLWRPIDWGEMERSKAG